MRRFPWTTSRSCKRLRPRAIPANCCQGRHECCLVIIEWGRNLYQVQPPRVRLFPQVLPTIEAIHILVDETESVFFSRVHPDKRYYVHILLMKEGPHVDFVVKPLRRCR